MSGSPLVIFLLTTFTMISFAGNSLLCRMALSEKLIDPASFTSIRLISGAFFLFLISLVLSGSRSGFTSGGTWLSGFALFAYAGAFSLAYVSLNTGTGAIILFGTVQITMMTFALKFREKISLVQWIGLVAAFAGLVYLVYPGITAPDFTGAVLMCVSGIAWSIYSIRGKNVQIPLQITCGNFIRSVPFALVISFFFYFSFHMNYEGLYLAVLSGGITSGIGYVTWYFVLKKITTTQASVVQLIVPLLAAMGGVLFLSEEITFRLVTAGALVLSGVGFAIFKK